MTNVSNHYVKSMTAMPWEKFGEVLGVPVWFLKTADCTFYAINTMDPKRGIRGEPVHRCYVATDLPSIHNFILMHARAFPTPAVAMRTRDAVEDEKSEKDWMWKNGDD